MWKIAEKLYLGNRKDWQSGNYGPCNSVINVSREERYYPPKKIKQYFSFALADANDPRQQYMHLGAFFCLDAMMQRGRTVLVHCTGGLHRSVSVILLYLMYRHNMDIMQAFKHVQETRGRLKTMHRWQTTVQSNFGLLKAMNYNLTAKSRESH